LAGSSKPGVGTSIVVGPTCGGSQGTATTTALRSNHSQATVSRIWGQWSRMDGNFRRWRSKTGWGGRIKKPKSNNGTEVSRLENERDAADSGQSSRKDSGRGRAHGQRAGTLYQVSRSNMGHGAQCCRAIWELYFVCVEMRRLMASLIAASGIHGQEWAAVYTPEQRRLLPTQS
jgi:hypothetical protein